MRRTPIIVATVFLAASSLVACGNAEDDTPDPDPLPQLGDGESDGDLEDREAVDGSDALVGDEVQAAIRDAAESEGVDTADIEVVTSELVTWPDSSLGCPQPDEMYTQALVDGYRIVLDVDGTEIAYHGQMGQEPFRCDNPEPPVS